MKGDNPFIRFARYSIVGVSTFAFDLALLFILTDFLRVQYLLSAAIAFTIAVSINYALSRRHVFARTERSVHAGYVFFLLIAGAGLCAVTALMYVAVEILDLHYLLSRILIAGVVGLWTYFMNLYVNFRVAGKE